jgi:hypothetical protein
MRRPHFTRLEWAGLIAFILFTVYGAFDSLSVGKITSDLDLSLSIIGGFILMLIVGWACIGAVRLYYKIVHLLKI